MKKGSGPKKALLNRQAVVDGALHTPRPVIADHHEFHAALGDHHVRLAPEKRARIDDFEAAFAEASAARTYQDAAPRWADVARKFPAALKEAVELIDRGLLMGVTLSPRLRALCGRGGSLVEDSSDETSVVTSEVAEEGEGVHAVRDAFARETLASMRPQGVDVPAVSELPSRSARTRKPSSASGSAPATASSIALPPKVSAKVRGKTLTIIIDPEIVALIPRQSEEELALLETSLLREGCRDPVVAWADGRRRVLLDGHTRVFFCRKNSLRYNIKELTFSTRAEAIMWVLAAQLARRNLGPEWHSYLRGRYYNALKAQGARHDLTSGKTSQKLTTAQRIAQEHRVDEKTVRSDGRFAKQLDQLSERVGADLKDIVLARGVRVSRRDVARIAALEPKTQRQVVQAIRDGATGPAALQAHGGAEVKATRKAPAKAPASPNVMGQGPALPQPYTFDALTRDLARGVALLKGAVLGSLEESVLAAIDEQAQALDAEIMRHGLAAQRTG